MDTGLRLLKGILCRLNYNANSIHTLAGHLMLKEGVGALKIGMETYGRTLMQLSTLNP